MIFNDINDLIGYATERRLITVYDHDYVRNSLLSLLSIHTWEEPESGCGGIGDSADKRSLACILAGICEYAASHGLIGDSVTERDLFDTKVMGLITPRPTEVINKFIADYSSSPETATDNFYKLNTDCNYIRTDRIARDIKWVTPTEYGNIEITVNLSKPEKDPRAIAAVRNTSSGYPMCQLCRQNVGYEGRLDHPARENLRIIPICLGGEEWWLQYSPYVYYNEHCIALCDKHRPMQINEATFKRLLDFVSFFPHYFIGSNADLPIVGGSILSHDHFQGGKHDFAMAKSPIETPVVFKGFESCEAGIVKWPMSVIRLRSEKPDELIALAARILDKWRGYSDEKAFIFASTDNAPHNTITPIARFTNEKYELDLVLRNNITTDEHPIGLYHPHAEKHHIKKENIGLIEVMGLAVLPARLVTELALVADAMVNGKDLTLDDRIAKHADWAKTVAAKYETVDADNVDVILRHETGLVFASCLEDAGVYKRTESGKEAFMRFVAYVNSK